VRSVLEGMGSAKALGTRFLTKVGIGEPKAGQWYQQQKWLDAFKEIAGEIGPNTLFQIGLAIPRNAVFPPEIDTIQKALSAIDIAYHMNHRLDGKVLFDGAKMGEGIGHYTCTPNANGRSAVVVCANPYPCDFDKGIIEAMARRFKPATSMSVSMRHDDGGCRKNGNNACTWHVSW
jgi:hypothetical protein